MYFYNMNLKNTSTYLKFPCFILVFLFFSFLLSAQTPILSGQWKGKIYQTNGSVKTEYDIELYLQHLPSEIVGRSYIYADDIFAEIKIKGTFTEENVFEFRDVEIMHSEQGTEMSWCMKSVFLRLTSSKKGWELKGSWTGKNEYSSCNPGTLILKKMISRA